MEEKKNMKLVIDLGGTNLRIGAVEDEKLLCKKEVDCPASGSEQDVINAIKTLIKEMYMPTVDGIGIGVPSVVDAEQGIVYDVSNIPSWKEVHLKDILEKEFGVTVKVDNDVNCFILGEKFFGAGKEFDNLVGVTLGTGVGSGIIIDGKLYRGENTGAGEIGSLPYLDSDYEHYCNRSFVEQLGHHSGYELDVNAMDGDATALDVWNQLGFHLGKLLQVVLFTYDPQAIIIGGGLSNAHPFFEEAMWKSLRDGFPYLRTLDKIQIKFSKLKSCNLLGASKL
jgi:glucokinase